MVTQRLCSKTKNGSIISSMSEATMFFLNLESFDSVHSQHGRNEAMKMQLMNDK